jgi:hypothetical protein
LGTGPGALTDEELQNFGVLLIGRHDFVEAGRRLEDSLAGCDQAAALRDGRRVRHLLRGIGIRRRIHPRHPAEIGLDEPDRYRARRSDLVAKGLTNQQIAAEMFLSTHTIAFHLRQVFRKLDIGSRVDLARVCTEQAQTAKAPTGSVRPGKGRTWRASDDRQGRRPEAATSQGRRPGAATTWWRAPIPGGGPTGLHHSRLPPRRG